MKQIIITGATSFIGIPLIRKLLEGDYKIFAVIRRSSKRIKRIPVSEKVKICELNMQEYSRIPELIHAPCEACMMLAWDGTRGTARDDKRLQHENYRNSMECVRAVCRMGCRKIISAGSQAEYGMMSGITTEASECVPVTEYGKAKLRFYEDAGQVCREYGVSWKEPRFFSLYGEDDDPQTMIPSILSSMLENKPCALTACRQDWNFLHIEDAVRGLVLLLERECGDGAYNFASGDTRRLKEFVEEMYRITHSKSRLCYGAVPYPPSGMVSMRPSAERLRMETGWQPNVPFSEGIQRLIRAMAKEGSI